MLASRDLVNSNLKSRHMHVAREGLRQVTGIMQFYVSSSRLGSDPVINLLATSPARRRCQNSMPSTHPIPRSRLAPPHEARVQATRPDGMLVGHPGEEPLQAETVSAVRRGAVPNTLSAIMVQVGKEMTKENSLSLVGVPVVGLVGDAVLLVRLDQLVVVVHPHGAADDLADARHCITRQQLPSRLFREEQETYSARQQTRSPVGRWGPSSCRTP